MFAARRFADAHIVPYGFTAVRCDESQELGTNREDIAHMRHCHVGEVFPCSSSSPTCTPMRSIAPPGTPPAPGPEPAAADGGAALAARTGQLKI